MKVILKTVAPKFAFNLELREMNKLFNKSVSGIVKTMIINSIQSGRSPVMGEGVYEKYSKPYAKRYKGGKLRPVNLTLTGGMLNSFKTRALSINPTTYIGGSIIWFSSSIAKYHNKTGKVIRRMLPSEDGEKFVKYIRDEIKNIAEIAFIKAFKK